MMLISIAWGMTLLGALSVVASVSMEAEMSSTTQAAQKLVGTLLVLAGIGLRAGRWWGWWLAMTLAYFISFAALRATLREMVWADTLTSVAPFAAPCGFILFALIVAYLNLARVIALFRADADASPRVLAWLRISPALSAGAVHLSVLITGAPNI